MARPAKKNIYEKIIDKQKEINETQILLNKLNEELQILQTERDNLCKI